MDPAKGRLSFLVGREYQPDFFERIVQKQDDRQTISRSHFELVWEPPSTVLVLRKLSGNPLILDDRPMSNSEATRVAEGTQLCFAKMDDSPRFLVLKVTLRSRGAVQAEGVHPAVALSMRRSTQGASASPVAALSTLGGGVLAVLECIASAGGDVSKLTTEERIIAMPLDKAVDIGRHHQPNFYEKLLKDDSRWLTFISRSHCRAVLQRLPEAGLMATASASSGYGLSVENLSSNAIMVKKLSTEERRLGKGRTETLSENDKLVFIANPGGAEGEVHFLTFLLRRARG